MSNEARSHAHTVTRSVVRPRLDKAPSHEEIFKKATTPEGSKALQRQLPEANDKERQVIVNQLLDHVVPLTNNMYGTYVIIQVL